jgi:hypothetical protein
MTGMTMRSDSIGPSPDDAWPVVATMAMACPGDSRRALASALIQPLMLLACGLGPLDIDLSASSRLERFLYRPVISALNLQNTRFDSLLTSYIRQLDEWAWAERVRAACGPLRILVQRCNYAADHYNLYPNGDLDRWPTEPNTSYWVEHEPEGDLPTSVSAFPGSDAHLILRGPGELSYRASCPDGAESGANLLAEALDEFRKSWKQGVATYEELVREHGCPSGKPFKDLADRLRYNVEPATQEGTGGKVLRLQQKWSVTFPSVIDVYRYAGRWQLRLNRGQIVSAWDCAVLAEALGYAFPSFAQGWDRGLYVMKKYLSATAYERDVVPPWKRGW